MIRALPVASLCFLVLGILYLGGSLKLPMGSADRPGPGFFPLWVGIALVALGLPLFLRSLPGRGARPEEEPFPRGKDLQRVVALAVTLFLFVFFLKPLGYVFCSTLLMGGILRLLGLRSWGRIVLISILAAALSYYLFASLLGVPLPRGIFFS